MRSASEKFVSFILGSVVLILFFKFLGWAWDNFEGVFKFMGGIFLVGIVFALIANKNSNNTDEMENGLNSNKNLNVTGEIENKINIDEQAMLDLAKKYQESGEYDKAMPLLLEMAQKGNVDCQFDLGEAYRQGLGVTTNIDRSIYWYNKAAKQNDLHAQFALGVMYLSEDEFPNIHNKDLAFMWIDRASQNIKSIPDELKNNNLDFINFLGEVYYYSGLMYENGWGTNVNHLAAFSDYIMGIKIGSAKCELQYYNLQKTLGI